MTPTPSGLDLYMLPAANGDCLWLEYGAGPERKRILVDCGTESSWPALQARILRQPEDQRHFDLLVITHIDGDHIGGALPLLKHRHVLGLSFGEIWFNDADAIVATGLGVGEGIVLSKILGGDADLRRAWNRSTRPKAVGIPELKPGTVLPGFDFGELRLTLLSPTRRQLRRLKDKWSKVVAELDEKRKRQPGFVIPAEKWLGGSATGTASSAPCAARDTSVANGSSIAFLATYRGTSILFGADAFAPTLRKSLDHLRLAQPISGFKLSHHGSKANLTAPLLAAASSRHYLFSSDGSEHGHPHPETLEMVTAGDTPKTLHFNYRAQHVLDWLAAHPAGRGRNYAFAFVDAADYRVGL